MSTPESVLILGARGRFGLAAARAFAQAGWQVHAQMRPGAAAPAIEGVHWLAADPEDTAALAAAAAGARVVVQALSPEYTHKAWRTEVPRLTEAAARVGRELRATLLLPASVYNFGAAMPALLHEDTPQHPSTFKGRMRLASEQTLRQATSDGRLQVVVVRGGDFFGSGRGSWLDLAIAKDLRRGRMNYPGAAGVPTAWAYLPDMARAFVAIAAQRQRLGSFETLHFGGYSLARQDWAEALAGIAREQGWLQAGQPLRVNRMSWPLLRAVGLFVPTVAALAEMRYLWRTPHALANRRLKALIGEEPHTPFPLALRAALAELGMLGEAAPEQAAAPASQARFKAA